MKVRPESSTGVKGPIEGKTYDATITVWDDPAKAESTLLSIPRSAYDLWCDLHEDDNFQVVHRSRQTVLIKVFR
jgi:hypothetical protein